jgi:hypothetical protein
MSQISASEAIDLLEKLVEERIPVMAFFIAPTGVRAQLRGVLTSAAGTAGLVIAAASQSAGGPYVRVPLGNRAWTANYGEHRQLPPELQEMLPKYGESVLALRFPETREVLSLFFTI